MRKENERSFSKTDVGVKPQAECVSHVFGFGRAQLATGRGLPFVVAVKRNLAPVQVRECPPKSHP
jgi:hypothetical protein